MDGNRSVTYQNIRTQAQVNPGNSSRSDLSSQPPAQPLLNESGRRFGMPGLPVADPGQQAANSLISPPLLAPLQTDSNEARLFAAIRRSDSTAVKSLLTKLGGLDMNLLDPATGLNPLLLAAALADGTVLFALCRSLKQTDLQCETSGGESALSLSTMAGNEEVVEFLLEKGATQSHKNFALIKASAEGKVGILKRLLTAGAQVDACDEDANTALHHAAQRGDVQIIAELASAGAKGALPNQSRQAPLDLAVEHGRTQAVRGLITLFFGAAIGDASLSPLLLAAIVGDVQVLEYLLSHGEDASAVSAQGDTALLLAARHGHAKAVSTLLQFNTRIDHANHYGNTALLTAAEHGHEEVVKILAKKSWIHQANLNGDTALCVAARKGHVNIVMRLLVKGAKLEHANAKGDTALLAAAQAMQFNMTELLRLAGANIEHANHEHKKYADFASHRLSSRNNAPVWREELRPARVRISCLSEAIAEGELNHVLDYLRIYKEQSASGGKVQASVDLHFVHGNGRTPLLLAAMKGRVEIAKALLEHGARLDHIDKDGNSAFSLAAVQDKPEALDLLLQACPTGQLLALKNHALLRAALSDKTPMVELLLAAGAEADHRSTDGLTILMRLVHRHAGLEDQPLPSVLPSLLRHADIYLKDQQGRIALQMAYEANDLLMVNLLVQHYWPRA